MYKITTYSRKGKPESRVVFRKVYIVPLRGQQFSTHPSSKHSMDNSTATQLQGDVLLLTQIEFVTPTTVAGTLYGIAFTLFCLYVHSLAPQLRDEERKRQAIFMLVYSSIIMLCGLYDLVTNAWFTQEYYLKHYDYPQGPYIYGTTTLHTPLTISSFTCQVAIDALTSAIQVQYCCFSKLSYKPAKLRGRYGVYGLFGVLRDMQIWWLRYLYWVTWHLWVSVIQRTRYFYKINHILPGLFLRTLVLEGTQPVAELPILDQKPELIEFALQAAVTILSSMSISLYLVFQHRRQRKLIGREISRICANNLYKHFDRGSARIYWIHECCYYDHRVICAGIYLVSGSGNNPVLHRSKFFSRVYTVHWSKFFMKSVSTLSLKTRLDNCLLSLAVPSSQRNSV